MPLAQAQARVPGLAVMPADPPGDAQALGALAGWCLRVAPLTAPDAPDGIWIDATGTAHLHGGEQRMLTGLVAALAGRGIAACAAMADTPGAAWAVARFGGAAQTVVPAGETQPAIARLPIAALRLADDTKAALQRLGFDRIDRLLAAPRAPLTLRFGPAPLRRLDQALGRVAEPIQPAFPPDLVQGRLAFPEPLLTPEALSGVTARLADAVCAELERRGQGARRLDLIFERVDGTRQAIRIGTARPSRQPRHLARLLDEQLERVDPGLGVEAMRLVVPLADALAFAQPGGGLLAAPHSEADMAVLVDRLANRLGARRVYRLAPVESDVPERSTRRIAPIGGGLRDAGWPACLPRPVRLLKHPQPVDVMAMLPDHPPAFFVWRRRRHLVRRADGPERIAGEWWKRQGETLATRDYWQVEDEQGTRFWLYRSGDAVDPATGDRRWYLHGLF
jgi:protein ImuB